MDRSDARDVANGKMLMSKPCDFLIPELLRRGATIKNVLPTAVKFTKLAEYLPVLLVTMKRTTNTFAFSSIGRINFNHSKISLYSGSYGESPTQVWQFHHDLRAPINDDGDLANEGLVGVELKLANLLADSRSHSCRLLILP